MGQASLHVNDDNDARPTEESFPQRKTRKPRKINCHCEEGAKRLTWQSRLVPKKHGIQVTSYPIKTRTQIQNLPDIINHNKFHDSSSVSLDSSVISFPQNDTWSVYSMIPVLLAWILRSFHSLRMTRGVCVFLDSSSASLDSSLRSE